MAKQIVLSIGLLGLTPAMAFAAPPPDFSRMQMPMNYPVLPKARSDAPRSSYPMNYIDEAAQTLGVRNGRLDLFSSHPAGNNVYMPAVSGSVSGKGAMLRLQWHPGE